MDKQKMYKTGRWMRGSIIRPKRKSEIKNNRTLKKIKDSSEIEKGNEWKTMPELHVEESFAKPCL
jgi:glutaredoxin-related protein